MDAKTISQSKIEANYIVMPNHANPSGAAFGGTIISWIDICAAMVAQKHAASDVVTVHIDEITFNSPVMIGEHVHVKGSLKWAGKTSMVVSVEVFGSDPKVGKSTLITTVILTMVAINEERQSKKVPAINLQTVQEKESFKFYEERNLRKRLS